MVRRFDLMATVSIKRAITIPARCEVVVKAQLQGTPWEGGTGMVEPLHKDQRGLWVARSVVEPSGGSAVVRVFNTSAKPIRLKKKYRLGTLESVDVTEQNLDEEEKDTLGPGGVCCQRAGVNNTLAPAAAGPPDEMPELITEEPGVSDDFGPPVPELIEEDPEDAMPSHLEDLYSRTSEQITDDGIRERMRALLIHAQAAFARDKADHGKCDLASCKINTRCAAPIKQHLRPTPRNFEKEEFTYLKTQVETGVIRPSTSPWASPVVLVRKRDGTVRWCVDFRQVNDVTVKEVYPLPRIDVCLDSLAEAKVFSTLDLQSGYWQLAVDEVDRAKTAFITRYGLYEYNRMPFGLANAVSTFQRCMELVLRGLQWEILLIYLDDVIIYSSDQASHLGRLETVLKRLGDAGLKLKPSKCQLFRAEVEFLGHMVSEAGITPCPRNIDAVKQWTSPRSVKEILQFIGLCSYYRQFIQLFSDIATPMTNLTGKGVEWVWGAAAEMAFQTLKAQLIEAPVLAFPREGLPFTLDTDASDVGVGAVLSQTWDGAEHVIAYGSKKLSKTQTRYSVTRRELLAVVVFVHQYRHYLLGDLFTLRTDHSALQWIRTFKEPRGQLARWLETLAQYNFDLVHRPGKKHQNADALSRADLERRKENPMEWSDFAEKVDNIDDVAPVRPMEFMPDVSMRLVVIRPVTRSQSRKQEALALEARSQDPMLPTTPVTSLPRTPLVPAGADTGETSEPGPTPIHGAEISRAPPVLASEATSGPDPEATTSKAGSPVIPRTPLVPADRALLGNLEAVCLAYTADELEAAQAQDPEILELLGWLKTGKWPEGDAVEQYSPSLRNYLSLRGELQIRSGVLFLCHLSVEGVVPTFKLVVPKNLKKEILELCHSSRYAGHMGVNKTTFRIKQRFHWYSMSADVRRHVGACEACEVHKRAGKKGKYPLSRYVVGFPLDRVGMDLLGPFPTAASGNKYVLVIGDYFTRWMEAYALPDMSAEGVARRFVLDFIARLGVPLKVTSYQGRTFVSETMANVCELLEIAKTRITSYRPMGNGLVERFNGTLVKMLRTYATKKPTEWDEYLPLVMAAYRATEHPATGFTPNYLMYGREVTTPIELAYPLQPREFVSTSGYAQEMEEALLEAYQHVRVSLKQAAERQKKSYDTGTHINEFSPGDAVYQLCPVREDKLSPRWRGPFIVVKLRGGPLYLVQGARKAFIAHQDRLKAYRPALPSWASRVQADIRGKRAASSAPTS